MKKAIIVGIDRGRKDRDFLYSMKELENLAEACNIEILGEFTQKLDKPTPNFYFGTGKINELVALSSNDQVDLIIFNDELTSLQYKCLTEILEKKFIDRTLLVLDIFATRAKTKEAILQVELAQLKYMKPRLLGLKESLSRQQGGIGSKGPGEKKIELNRRLIEDEIIKLEHDLDTIKKNRQIQRKKRITNKIPIVSLVGYTNAGKSTLMNRFISNTINEEDKKVFEKDMLFATLDTTVRLIKLNDNREFLLVDTVGFISKLPHHLVNSFRSTLEDTLSSDLILHVIDLSSNNYKLHEETTINVLNDLDTDTFNTLKVYNKIDLAKDKINEIEDSICISAKQNINIDGLTELIVKNIFKDYKICDMLIPFDKGNIYNTLKNNSLIIEEEFINEGTKIKVELSVEYHNKYKEYIIKNYK